MKEETLSFSKFNNVYKNAKIKLDNDSCLVFISIYISKMIDLKIQGVVNKYFFFNNMGVAKKYQGGYWIKNTFRWVLFDQFQFHVCISKINISYKGEIVDDSCVDEV
jgi:hypothetical protein